MVFYVRETIENINMVYLFGTIMTNITKTKQKQLPLIIEPHPKDYTGFPFITLIQYRKAPLLTVVDNINDSSIQVYVLDWCGPEGVSEELVLSIVEDWHSNNKNNYPISIEFAKRGLIGSTSKIYRTFNLEFVSRIIGPISKFPMSKVRSISRRRKKTISDQIEVVDNYPNRADLNN